MMYFLFSAIMTLWNESTTSWMAWPFLFIAASDVMTAACDSMMEPTSLSLLVFTTTVKNWINNTDKTSAAFDFPFRYTVRNALRGSANDKDANNWKQDPDYRLLSSTSITSDADYRQYAVTFVENHDTEYRSSTAQQDPIRKDTLAANAFLLAMPGTPCVFFKHWQTYKSEIKAMIEARKLAGITNTSTYSNFRNN